MRKNLRFEIVRAGASILLALAVAMVFIFAISKEPWVALYNLIVAPMTNVRYLWLILERMIPIIFTGLGVCVMFNANQFNLAGEGCLYVGAFVSALCAIYLRLPPLLHVTLSVVVAMLVGGIVMLVPSLLKTKLGASEMVSSLMLNYILLQLVLYYLNYYFSDRDQGATMTHKFQESAQIPKFLPSLIGRTNLSWGIVIALLVTVLVALFLYRTKWGYAIRMIGINESFAKYSGIKVGFIVVLCQVIGGVLSAMGGAVEMLGYFDRFKWKQLPGYGWNGVTIAILAKNNPALVPLAAFFIAYLERGCLLMQINSDVPAEMLSIIQAVIFLFFAAEQFLAKYRHKLVVRGTKEEIAVKAGEAQKKGAQS